MEGRRQVSLDGVSGDVLDAMVEEPVIAGGLDAPGHGTPAAGAKRARRPGKGKARAFLGTSSGELVPLQPDSMGMPQQPTLLPRLTPVSPDLPWLALVVQPVQAELTFVEKVWDSSAIVLI